MNFRKMLSIITVAVLCLSLFSGCGENKGDGNTVTDTTEPVVSAEKTITLVVGAQGDGFNESIKKGGEDAAEKYGFRLEYIGLEDTEEYDASAYINMLKKVSENDTSGVIIAPFGEGFGEALGELHNAGIPVVQINSISDEDSRYLEERNINPVVSTVSTDYKQAGSLCAEKLFEKVKENIKNSDDMYVIGVIKREDFEADDEKADAFAEKFSELADADEAIKGKYKIETKEGADSLGQLMSENVKAVFITHPEIADKISDTVSADREKYKNIIFCGFDSGAKQLKWLNDGGAGEFIGGVAQDFYNLGYNAVEQCVFAIQGKELKPEIKIEAKWYDKSNADKMKQNGIIFEK